jgi:FkbM family methyltransferase
MSLLMARTAKHVYAFEPAPHAIEQLRLQLAANNFDNVTIVTNPVSNSVREVDFSLTETAYGSRIGNGDTKWRTIKLQTITLDEFTTTNPMPDFMKIDVEDEEGQVLEGAKSILRRGTTVILCELHSQRSQETALDLLGRFGYRFRGLDGGPFRALAPGDRGFSLYPEQFENCRPSRPNRRWICPSGSQEGASLKQSSGS